MDNKDQKSAELYINTLEKKDLKDPDIIYILAKLEYLKSNYDASERYLEEYLDNGGPEGDYYLLKGKILARKKTTTVQFLTSMTVRRMAHQTVRQTTILQ
ncbi:hypothetical protein QYZ44_18305 [Vibrio parahaemolyticus]|nr:hypothetical protein [Vibrio parahaemolyticus]